MRPSWTSMRLWPGSPCPTFRVRIILCCSTGPFRPWSGFAPKSTNLSASEGEWPVTDVLVPFEQEGTKAIVRSWLKKPGDRVSFNDPLVELETDKVTQEVPSPGD